MTISRGVRRLVVLAIVAMLAGVGAVACGGSDAEQEALHRSGTVELRWELPEGTRWEMRGPLVDAGTVCAHGYHRDVAMLDPTTREALTLAEFLRRVEQSRAPGQGVDAIMVAEKRCADGSGSFVVEDWPAAGEFRVISGTGAYRSMRGEGAVSSGADLEGRFDWVHVQLELDLDAAP